FQAHTGSGRRSVVLAPNVVVQLRNNSVAIAVGARALCDRLIECFSRKSIIGGVDVAVSIVIAGETCVGIIDAQLIEEEFALSGSHSGHARKTVPTAVTKHQYCKRID